MPGCRGELRPGRGAWHCDRCDQPVIRPQPGPQERASASAADIVCFGGGAGGGKSWSILFEAARHVRTPGYAAYIFRRTTRQVTGGGGLWAESVDLFSLYDGKPREGLLDWTFETDGGNATIQFAHLEHEKNKTDYQGKEIALLAFDEATHFTETQFQYLQTRARTTCGVKPKVFLTCNPDPDSWVRRWVDWWIGDDGFPIPERSGVLRWFARMPDDSLHWGDSRAEVHAHAVEHVPALRPEHVKSFTFIPSKLDDNKILTDADPSYLATLLSQPRVIREQLLGGNWNIKATAGSFFRSSYFEIVDAVPPTIRERVRAWDLAATRPTKENPDPDWSVGVKVAIDKGGTLYVEHVERLRDGPLGVETAIQNMASADGRRCKVGLWQDPGQAGKTQIDHYRRKLLGFTVTTERAARDKQTYAGPPSSSAEGGNIKLVRGSWNAAFVSTLEGFPDAKHDDDVDALSLAHLKLVRSNLERLRRLAGRT